jgi:hypothetical protein
MRTVIVPFAGFLNSKFKKLCSIAKLARRTRLTISNQDELGANVIALDIRKRKLLYARRTPGAPSCLIIDLNSLDACSIRKEYGSINAGELKTNKLHHFLKGIFLKLVFKNGSGAVSLPLYDAQKESLDNVEQLEAQAKKWENLVSKLLPVHIKERA